MRGQTTMPQREPELISITEAARMLNVSTRTVNRLCLDGKLKAVRIGCQWRINRKTLRKAAGLD
jgi:excisionase family DNA binding protein